MKDKRHHRTVLLGCNFKNCCHLIALLLIGYSGFSQQTLTEDKNEIETLLSSITEQLENAKTDSMQIQADMFRVVRLSKQANDKSYLIKSYYNLATWHKGNATIDFYHLLFKPC